MFTRAKQMVAILSFILQSMYKDNWRFLVDKTVSAKTKKYSFLNV